MVNSLGTKGWYILVEHFFSGSVLCAMDEEGRLSLPSFIRKAVECRSGERAILVRGHETAPCLTAYDRRYRRDLHIEMERRRLAEETAGVSRDLHHSRMRRVFGIVEDVSYDDDGTLAIPPFMRRKGGLERQVLLVGAGGTFEIWDPRAALESGDDDLREICAFHLEKHHHIDQQGKPT